MNLNSERINITTFKPFKRLDDPDNKNFGINIFETWIKRAGLDVISQRRLEKFPEEAEFKGVLEQIVRICRIFNISSEPSKDYF